MNTLSQQWELDSIFAGGSGSKRFQIFLNELEQAIQAVRKQLEAQKTPFTRQDVQPFTTLVERYESLCKHFNEAAAFIECLTAQNIKDQAAAQANNRMHSLGAELDAVNSLFETVLRQIADDEFQTLINAPQLRAISFSLNEKRTLSHKKLEANQEQLISALAVDGYHAWEDLYYQLIGKMEITVVHHGKKEPMSVSQANNLLNDADRSVRQAAFQALESAWSDSADLFAAALNHIAGFRIAEYQARGWDDVLDEPLDYNRISKQTLNTMWETVTAYKPKLSAFLKRKAALLHLNKLSWYDIDAPLQTSSEKISYEEAASFIVKHFASFNPNMASFARNALENRWIEAENRPNKRPGGFCTSFPLSGQSRIFMTFNGSTSNRSTLAHELGHAYHQSLMNDLPYLSQDYAMNVAETASTFSEMIVSDAGQAAAKTKQERIAFLSDKLGRSIALLMNIHARLLFETRFYEARKAGSVSVDRLNQLMTEAQREAFCNQLDTYHPTFWASKLHFYITNWPFYNFPYTFGYLFSTGIYVQALQEGPAFAKKYDALLRDTGRMTTETLAKRHLGADLTKPKFWSTALDYIIRDVDEFLALTSSNN
ncbi:M3 family oligoendopeptidase [Sporolactobacillus terrae]|uniref:Oligoendopeptidase n=1 Tax=Sporolactobacillus terrae TaxID=269673 RepID=A0ABX5Q9A8_9BACL|nr:M3 family oligoendopeptidase [Sporolactobacillus terrae]QAA23253.1 oligoendopeptidase [Sporolactobacillus terrae]QAA26223.1 oligoendopeptidase [Sporolactobacillus terrae]UAK15319.1 M3 family oligoendopeptidase [Sporolactobacillus terrae]